MLLDRLTRRACCCGDRIELIALFFLGTVLIVAVVLQNTIAPLPLESTSETFCSAVRRVEVVHDIDDDACCISYGKITSLAQENYKFVKDGYNERLYNHKQLNAQSLYVDVGAFDGGAADVFHERYRPQMLLIEPSPSRFNVLRAKYDIFPNVDLRNVAVGPRNEDAYLFENGYGSYVTHEHTAGSYPIRIQTWPTIMQTPRKIDLLYINCEGCEYIVLDALMNSTTIADVQTLYVQFHKQYQDDAPYKRCAIRHRLRKTHKLVYQVTWVWEIWELRP